MVRQYLPAGPRRSR